MNLRPAILAFAALLLVFPVSALAHHSCERDSECDDGIFCNGNERCRPFKDGHDDHGCIAGTPTTCKGEKICREDLNKCALPVCEKDEDCDDGRFCNGIETCALSGGNFETGCRRGTTPCGAHEFCTEAKDLCFFDCSVKDHDGDGVNATQCGGADCDDLDGGRTPGNNEVCDAADKDEDCDPRTFGTKDADGDGSVDDSCCNAQPDGEPVCGTDCADSNASVSRDAIELCNGIDDDCDQQTDEGAARLLFPDQDGDLHGDVEGEAHLGCPGDLHTSRKKNDCDDTNPAIQPGAQICVSTSSLLICDPIVDAKGNVSRIYRDGLICGDGTTCYPQPNGTGLCATDQAVEPPDDGECLFPCFITPQGVCQCGGGDTTCPIGCFPGPQGCECGPE